METNFSKKQLEILALLNIDPKGNSFLRASNILLQVGSEFFKGLNFKMDKWQELFEGSEILKNRLLDLETNLHSYFSEINNEVNQQKIQNIEMEAKIDQMSNAADENFDLKKQIEILTEENKKILNKKELDQKKSEDRLRKNKLKYEGYKLDYDLLIQNLKKETDKGLAFNFSFTLSISSFLKPWTFKFENEEFENKRSTQIAILGAKDVGKSYVLSNLLEVKEKNTVFPSTFGTIAGKCIHKTLYLEYSETMISTFDKNNNKDIEKLEGFLEDFFLQNSNVLILVVCTMGRETQNYLEKIFRKKESIKTDQLFVILHNFQCYSNEEMKKRFKFNMKHFSSRIRKPDNENSLGYFDDERKVYHFPLGFDFGESTDFNIDVFSYIKELISQMNFSKVKFRQCLQNFFNENYVNYVDSKKGEKLELVFENEQFEIKPKKL